MVTRISVAILHVPCAGRDANVADLVRRLPSDWSVTVVEDPERAGCWPTARRAWAAWTLDSTHHLVLSDDAVLCDHFAELLLSAIDARPAAVMSLSTRARRPVDDAVLARRAWLHSDDAVFGQAILMPTQHVAEMLEWVEAYVRPSYEHDDGRVGMWARATRRGIYTPVPQLVRHMEGPSLMGHPAARGIGTPLWAADRRDVDWDTEAVAVAGSVFGGDGLRDDVAPEVARIFVAALPSDPARARAAQRLQDLRRRARGSV